MQKNIECVAVVDQRPAKQKQPKPTLEDLEKARQELIWAEQDFNMALEAFVDAAIHKYNAAMAKYQAIFNEIRRGDTDGDKNCPGTAV